jgi:ribosomal protein S27E
MTSSTHIPCEVCGQASPIAQNTHVDPLGKTIQWPKAAVKPEGVYFTIDCPKCGERQQLVQARPTE